MLAVQFMSMDNKIAGKRSMECKENNSKGVYSEK